MLKLKHRKKMHNFITQNENAQFYECGYSCDNAWLLKAQEDRYFITDSRYTLEAKELASKNTQIVESSNITQTLIDLINQNAIQEIVFDSLQVSVDSYQKISSQTKAALKAIPNFHQSIRIIKTSEEISKIKHSQMLNTQAYEKFAFFLQNHNQPLSEKQLHFHAKSFLQDFGKYDLSFEPILGINHNAAKPHALPSETLLKTGDLLLFDAGIKFERYCSDRTRTALFSDTIHFDKKQSFSDKEKQKVYDIVLKAQETTIQKIQAGMSAKAIDAIARDIITQSGYGKFFTHSTGHGIGLDIHELPFISPRSEAIIKDGMVFSIEPGIYIPNAFGVRIEDLVVIQNGKAHIL